MVVVDDDDGCWWKLLSMDIRNPLHTLNSGNSTVKIPKD